MIWTVRFKHIKRSVSVCFDIQLLRQGHIVFWDPKLLVREGLFPWHMNLNLACWRWEKHHLYVLLKVNVVDFFLLFYSSIILFIIKLAIYPALPRLSFLGSYFALRVFGLYNSFVRKHIFDTELAISATFGSEIQTFRPIIIWPLSQRFHRAILCQNRFSSFVRKRILDSELAISATFGSEIHKSGPVSNWPLFQRFHRAIICQNRFSSFVRKRGQTNTQTYRTSFY